MSFRGVTSPDRAFSQTLSDIVSRLDRMEKRQRWQGAIRGPYDVADVAGWSLSVGGSVITEQATAVEGGVWLVVAFCTWLDDGSDFGYGVEVNAVKIVVDEPEQLILIGTLDVPSATLDDGRFRSATFVGRVEFNAAFQVRFAAIGGPTEGASVSDVRMSVLAFPG